MKIVPFEHYNVLYILPTLSMTYETNYYWSIEIIWLKWGISIVIKDK